MQGLSSILSLFCNKFINSIIPKHKLDFINHITLKLLWNCFFGVNTLRFCYYVRNFVIDVMTYRY